MPSVLTFTEVGSHRLNEDVLVVKQHEAEPNLWLCFMADGQGGQPGGGPAAQLACEVALKAALDCSPQELQDQRRWAGFLRLADKDVEADVETGCTTFVGLCVFNGQIFGVSSGDSAALLVSRDQEVELTSGQRKNPPVGSGFAIAVTFTASINGPWQLLVMTDGVWKYVGWDRIVAISRRSRGAKLLAELQEAARLPGNGRFQDDFTVVLFEEDDQNAIAT